MYQKQCKGVEALVVVACISDVQLTVMGYLRGLFLMFGLGGRTVCKRFKN